MYYVVMYACGLVLNIKCFYVLTSFPVRFYFQPFSNRPRYDKVDNRAQHIQSRCILHGCTLFHDVDPCCKTQHTVDRDLALKL
jgi:hypothetical protein